MTDVIGAQRAQAETVLASLADGMDDAELGRVAGKDASSASSRNEEAGVLTRYVYRDGSRLRAWRSNTRPGVLVDAVSPAGRLTASRLVELGQTDTAPPASS